MFLMEDEAIIALKEGETVEWDGGFRWRRKEWEKRKKDNGNKVITRC